MLSQIRQAMLPRIHKPTNIISILLYPSISSYQTKCIFFIVMLDQLLRLLAQMLENKSKQTCTSTNLKFIDFQNLLSPMFMSFNRCSRHTAHRGRYSTSIEGTFGKAGSCGALFLTGLVYGGASSSSYCGGLSSGRTSSLSLPLDP